MTTHIQLRNGLTGSRSNSQEGLKEGSRWHEYEDVYDSRYSKNEKFSRFSTGNPNYDEYDEVNETEESNDVAVQTYLMTVSAGGRHQSTRRESARSPGQTPRHSSRAPKTPRRNYHSTRSRSTPRDHRPNLPDRSYSRAGRTPRPRARYINPFSRICIQNNRLIGTIR